MRCVSLFLVYEKEMIPEEVRNDTVEKCYKYLIWMFVCNNLQKVSPEKRENTFWEIIFSYLEKKLSFVEESFFVRKYF